MPYPLEIKKVYNFTLHAPSILGLGYNNAVVMAIMDYESAKLIQDITSLHSQVYSNLPNGTPRNAADLTYVKIKTVSGEIRVIANDWISIEPVPVTSNTLRVTIQNVNLSDIQLVKDSLIQNGFNNIEVAVV